MTECGHGENESEKQSNREKERRELIRGVLFDILWFGLDLWFVWPISHFWAVFLGSIVIAIHLLTSSWTIKKRLIYLVLLLLCTSFIIYIVPPNETEIHGFLVPGNDPSVSGPCEKVEALANSAYSVYFGGNEAILLHGQTAILVSKDDDPILGFVVTDHGLALSGRIFGKSGVNAWLVNNEFWINPNTTFHSERPDRSTLIIRDNSGAETLWVRYSNRQSVRIRGDLFFPEVARIIIADTYTLVRTPKVKEGIKGNCNRGIPVLIRIFQDGHVAIQ